MPKKKKIMHKFSMNAISTVDSPAQAPATMVIMKREDDEGLAKRMFDEALMDLQLSKEVYELIDEQWELNDALQSSIYSIVQDKDTYPDPVSAVKESLTQYASAVIELVNETKSNIDDEMNKAEIGKQAWQLANPVKPSETTKKSEEGEMPAPKTPEVTVESLAEELNKVNTELRITKAYGELNDIQKAHYKTLSKEAQGDFLGMTADQRSNEVTKSEGSNPVVYTATDGMEFRKNDDTRLVAMAKRADDNEKIANKERSERVNLEITKRVTEEIPLVPGEESTKISLYKAVDSITDETVKKSVYAMFKAHNELLKMSLVTRGDRGGAVLKAEDELEKKAREYQVTHKVLTYEKAYAAFLETPEGQILYQNTLSENVV